VSFERSITVMLNNISIGLFIDGGYFAKVYQDAVKHGYNLHVKKMMKFCVKYLSDHFKLNEADGHITERHYYRGRYKTVDAINKHILEEERRFEDWLIKEDVVFHYKHLHTVENEHGAQVEIEKGIDVWFALETYEVSIARQLDIVVIFTGDGDHEMLLNKLKAIKKKAILLTWHFSSTNCVSKTLSEEATLHIELSKLLPEHHEYLTYFEKLK
jgi:uncharacterized LabA/DUF88 family protein